MPAERERGAWRLPQRLPNSKEGSCSMNAKYVRALTFTFTVGVCLVLGGLGAFHMGRGSARAESAPRDFHAVDDYITARMETARIPGLSVAIVQGEQIVYLKGYGQADPS